jgi:hypothetical protein
LPSATATPTLAPTLRPTSPPQGPLQVLHAVPVPNPNPWAVAIQLAGDADGVTVRLWTVGFKLLAQQDFGAQPAGWSRLALGWGFLRGVPNGAYYLTVTIRRGAAQASSKPVKLLVYR